jgi:hypothetical protein
VPVFPSALDAGFDEKCLVREASRGTLPVAVPAPVRGIEEVELDVVRSSVLAVWVIRLFAMDVIDFLPAGKNKSGEEEDDDVVSRACAIGDRFLKDRIGRLIRDERTSMDRSFPLCEG